MAVYPLFGGGLLELQIVGQLHEQTTRNVFHYRIDNAAPPIEDGASYLAALIAQFQANVVTNLLVIQSEEFTIQMLTAQAILPIRYRQVQVVPTGDDAIGAVASPSCPSGTTFNVSLFAQRAGHKFQGRKFFPGLPFAGEENSQLTDDYLGALQDVANGCRADLTSVGAVAHPTVSTDDNVDRNLQQVVATRANRILRYQRRREIGKGE